jgi:O-antigen/teichoic acid export membrane protein
MGTGAIGLTLGLAFNFILSSVLLGILVTNVLKRSRINNLSFNFVDNCKNLLHSSVVNWIPLLITVIGSQLGTIVVFGSQGSDQAAVYFLALTIVTGLTSVMNSLFSIAIPALSALQDYRKRFAWQRIRLSVILLLPFSCSLIFYSEEIMRLIGDDYVKGSSFLQILLLSMLPMAILGGVNALVFSYGNYR